MSLLVDFIDLSDPLKDPPRWKLDPRLIDPDITEALRGYVPATLPCICDPIMVECIDIRSAS